MSARIDEIVETFGLLDDWEDRIRYVIELGEAMPRLDAADKVDANKVQGCASQVWLVTDADPAAPDPVMTFRGESDAHIVQGLVAILTAYHSGHRASDIVRQDPIALFDRIGLSSHLTPQRSNGVRSMVDRIRRDAARSLGAETPTA